MNKLIRPQTAPPVVSDDTYIADIKSGSSNMVITVRVRPENTKEQETQSCRNIVRVVNSNVMIFDPAETSKQQQQTTRGVPSNGRRAREERFAFDRIFDENTSQREVYENTTKFLLDGVLQGYNGTVFAYGATGAGKTYTMLGKQSEGGGVMSNTLDDLFRLIDERKMDVQCKVSVSYLEVYNETIRDLLVPAELSSGPLDLREDPRLGPVVSGLTYMDLENADEVMEQLHLGNTRRTQAPTDANATSSRSHAVLQIIVEQRDRTVDVKTDVKVGKLSLIDLAGSERAAATKNRGRRLLEGANINRSLLALGNCINSLATGKKTAHVPYRDSKLTRLLKDSLGGNCRTVMIANISPSSFCYEDTHNTLKYANRAKNIKTKVIRNVLNVDFHISKYTTLISELREENLELKQKLRENLESVNPDMAFGEEVHFVEHLKQEFMLSFNERMQIQETLADLEEHIHLCQGSIKRKKRQLMRLQQVSQCREQLEQAQQEQEQEQEEMQQPRSASRLKREIENATVKLREYINEREIYSKRWEKACQHARMLQEECGKIKSRVGKQFLDQEIELGVLKLQNFEATKKCEYQLTQLNNRDEELIDLDVNMSNMARLLRKQMTVLQENNLMNDELTEAYDALMHERPPASVQEREAAKDYIMPSPAFKQTATKRFQYRSTDSQPSIVQTLFQQTSTPRTSRLLAPKSACSATSASKISCSASTSSSASTASSSNGGNGTSAISTSASRSVKLNLADLMKPTASSSNKQSKLAAPQRVPATTTSTGASKSRSQSAKNVRSGKTETNKENTNSSNTATTAAATAATGAATGAQKSGYSRNKESTARPASAIPTVTTSYK